MILSNKRIILAYWKVSYLINNKGADQTADAQAGLRLCCLQTPKDRFSCVEAHLIPCMLDNFALVVFELSAVL